MCRLMCDNEIPKTNNNLEREMSMANHDLVNREDIKQLFKEYLNNGNELSPFNTEPCRRYLEEKVGEYVDHSDVLWLYYHSN